MILSKAKIFLICCLSFVASIFISSFFPVAVLRYRLLYFGLVVVGMVIMLLWWKLARARLIILIFIFLSLGVWRYSLSLPQDTPDKIWYYNLPAGQADGRTINFSGVVNQEPDIRGNSQKLEVAASFSDTFKSKISGKVLITTNLYPKYKYGDELNITCKLEAPGKFDDFAYDRYLARYNIYSVCYYPQIEKISANQGDWFYENIFLLKGKLSETIDFGLSEPAASLARPIVFGGQQGLEENVRQQFSQTGLTHIMAVSGFNISILAAVILSFLLGVGLDRRQSFYLTTIFLLIYVILVGAPASAMRAGLMGFLVLWALYLGRLNKIANAIILTAAILLFINPKLLRDDVGWQLSFLAVWGLIYGYPLINNFFEKIKIPKLYGLRDGLALTLAAQILTWPILAYNFSQVSLIAPLANVLVVWLIPILTVAIMLALLPSLLLPGLASLFFLPALLGVNYVFGVVKILSQAPYAYLEIGSKTLFWQVILAVYYLIVTILFVDIKNRAINNHDQPVL